MPSRHVPSMINVWTINGEPKLYGNGETGQTGITLPHFVPFLSQDNDFKCHVMVYWPQFHGLFMWWIFILFILVELFKLSYHILLLHCPRLCCQSFLWFFVFFIHVGGIVDNHFLSHLYLIKKTWCRFKSVDHENEVKIMWHMLDWHTQGDTRLFGNGQTPNNINLT